MRRTRYPMLMALVALLFLLFLRSCLTISGRGLELNRIGQAVAVAMEVRPAPTPTSPEEWWCLNRWVPRSTCDPASWTEVQRVWSRAKKAYQIEVDLPAKMPEVQSASGVWTIGFLRQGTPGKWLVDLTGKEVWSVGETIIPGEGKVELVVVRACGNPAWKPVVMPTPVPTKRR